MKSSSVPESSTGAKLFSPVMRQLPLQNTSFIFLEKSFTEWLDILGYAPATVRMFPSCVREFLYYLEKQGYNQINQIDIPLIRKYYQNLSQRANHRQGGGLSGNYLNVHLNAIEKLLEYLRKQGRILLPPTGIPQEIPNPEIVEPLKPEEIKSLYEATKMYEEEKPAYALRDRAILAVYYDCGLRRNEGVNLDIADVHFDQRLLEVKHAKGGQPRFVPFGKRTSHHLQDYRYEGRPLLLKDGREEAFFISKRGGGRVNGNTLNSRLKYMQQHTEESSLRQKPLHLHVLRHSIATHLLYQGMSIEKVAQFLGHRSLESTQIYTHLMEKVYG